MDWIKNILNTVGRNLIVKYLTRFILWGGAALALKYGVDAPSDDLAMKLGEFAAGVICAAVAGYIDLKHQRADKADIPPAQMVGPRVTPPSPGT
jgi:hypothetical protein